MGSFDKMIGISNTTEVGFNPEASCIDGIASYAIETMDMCMGTYVNLSPPFAPVDNSSTSAS